MLREEYNFAYFQNALDLFKKGNIAQAEENLRSYINHNPMHNMARIELASLLLTTICGSMDDYVNRRKEALSILDKVIDNCSTTDEDKNKALLLKATHLSTIGKSTEAYEIYQSLLNSSEGNEAKYGIAILSARLGDTISAKETLESYNGRYNTDAKIELCKISNAGRDFNACYKYLYKLNHSVQTDKILREQLFVEINQGNYQKAYEIFVKLQPAKYGSKKQTYNNIKTFLEYKLGIINEIQANNSYFMGQFLNYSRRKTLVYTKALLANDLKYHIYRSIDLNELISYLEEMVTYQYPYRCELYDYYVVRCYDRNGPYEIGKAKNEITDCIKVATLPGTNNIITIKPIQSIELIREKFERTNGNSRDKRK